MRSVGGCREKRQRTPSEPSDGTTSPSASAATIGPTPEITCTLRPTDHDGAPLQAPLSSFSWTTTPKALALIWKSKRSAFANLAEDNVKVDGQGETALAAHVGRRVSSDDDDAAILNNRNLMRFALTSLPLSLALQWNLSLDEARWVQSYCGQLMVGPNALRAFADDNGGPNGSLARHQTTSSMELNEDAGDEDAAKTLSWVKQSLVHISQAPVDHTVSPVEHPPLLQQPLDGAAGLVPTPPTTQRGGDVITVDTALATLQRARSVATGSTSLDNMLHGGLQIGFVTEVVGFACSGKTSLVGNWVAHAVVRGALESLVPLRKEPAHLHSHGGPPPTLPTSAASGGCRVCVIVSVGPNLHAQQVHHLVAAVARLPCYASEDDGRLAMDAVDRVRFVELHTVEALLDALPLIECALTPPSTRSNSSRTIASSNAQRGLLVIDSFAMLIHNSFSADPRASLPRHDAVASLMKQLKSMAEQCSVSVVLTTHATSYAVRRRAPSTQRRQKPGSIADQVDEGDEDGDVSMVLDDEKSPLDAVDGHAVGNHHAPGGDACSAFGNTFYHAVNNRFVLERVCVNGSTKAVMRVVKSPVCPPVAFEIASTAPAAASPLVITCTLADDCLQRAVAQAGLHGRGGVSRVPDLRHLNVASFLVPPKWNAYMMM